MNVTPHRLQPFRLKAGDPLMGPVMADADAAEVSSEAGVLPMRPVT